MNFTIQMLLPIIQQYMGKEFNTLKSVYQAVGYGLNHEQQIFVTTQYETLEGFLRTAEGKESLKFFVDNWKDYVNPKPVAELPPPVDSSGATS